jgi:hypothetical protein
MSAEQPLAPMLARECFLPKAIVCPHCLGQSGDRTACHACRGLGRVMLDDAYVIAAYVWPLVSCRCLACERLRTQGHLARLPLPRRQVSAA